jgi:hypothetical protein
VEEDSVTLLDPKEITELARLEQRLLARFSPPLPPEQVRRGLRDATARAAVHDRDAGGEAESSVA